MAYAKALREQIDRLSSDMRAIFAKCEKEDNRGLTPEEQSAWNKMADEHTRLEDSIKAFEKTQSAVDKLTEPDNRGRGVSPISAQLAEQLRDELRVNAWEEKEKLPYAKAFTNYLRYGLARLDSEQQQIVTQGFAAEIAAGLSSVFRNAQSTTTTQGGYLVPTGFSGILTEAMKWFGGIKGTVDEFETGTGNPFPWPTVSDFLNKGRIIGQNIQMVQTDIVFGQVTFNAYIGSSDLVLVPLALLEDSYFNIDHLLAKLLGIRLGRLFNWKCTTGAGVSAGEPTGIVTAAVAAGNLYTCPTGETTSISYNDLVNLEHSVDPAYRDNPSSYFMFSDAMLKILKKLVDGSNRPLWQPGLTASFREGAGVPDAGVLSISRPQILDHPYIVNNDMASPAANASTMLFGDMSLYKVRKVAGGVSVLRLVERYADYLQQGFTAFMRFDGNLIDAGNHPVAVLQQSAT